MNADEVKRLQEIARKCRLNCFDVLEASQVGHCGGSLSVIDILVTLYFDVANIRPTDPKWPARDRIILSKAHTCEGMYGVLGEAGFFPKEWFKTYGSFGSRLQGHAEITTPGVEYSGGGLGQGISYAMGVALAGRLDKKTYRTFCIMGDGECQEGEVWEAAMTAANYHLNELTVIVDANGYNTIGKTESAEALGHKWKAFGWDTYTVDGHDFQNLDAVLRGYPYAGHSGPLDAPRAIVAKTVKGKGVPSWEATHPHLLSGGTLMKGIQEGRGLLP